MLIQGAGQKRVQVANGGYVSIPLISVTVPEVTCGVSPSFGSWVQAEAALAQKMLVVGVTYRNKSTSTPVYGFALQIGVGGSGAEAIYSTLELQKMDGDRGGQMEMLPWPIAIDGGLRVALRGASSVGSDVIQVRLVAVRASDVVEL